MHIFCHLSALQAQQLLTRDATGIQEQVTVRTVFRHQVSTGIFLVCLLSVGLMTRPAIGQTGTSLSPVVTSRVSAAETRIADRSPETAVAGLDVADGLEVTLFASEPLLLSPSNIDVDHLGRVWVCEVVNYRRFANGNNPDRPAGDRILVLEDSDGDGRADRQTTFYQGSDIDSAHGVCVLGNRVIVSAGDSVFSFHDDNGDLKADRREVLFTGIKGIQHDHGIHSFLFGPDGRLYFNFGNNGEELHRPDGAVVVDIAGNEVRAIRRPYQEGMAFRCELDGSDVDTLGWNFRNNWELCVDSFGGVWQSDNDDDGNRSVRINFLMEYGNYGYKDALSGATWQTERSNLEETVPLRHWHQNDPGVVPNLLVTGGGSPTGILIYEGDALPQRFLNQLIHCDAGPNIVRSYSVRDCGAGYQAEIHDMLSGTRDQWFRPSDVCVAPDGSLIVADWYDPGVGGHRQGDVDRGRLFRVSLPGRSYRMPTHDLDTVTGAAVALKNPNLATRYLAWQKLRSAGVAAEKVLQEMYERESNPRFRARALWLLGQIEGRTRHYVELATSDGDSSLRMTGLRMARRMKLDVTPVVAKLSDDPSPQVRRECAIALRHCRSSGKPELWAKLASQYDGSDRWYLEALCLGADTDWDRCIAALLQVPAGTGGDSSHPAGISPARRDLIWRSRSSGTAALLVDIIRQLSTAENSEVRTIAALFRSLDFQPEGIVPQQVLRLLAQDVTRRMDPVVAVAVVTEALQRIDPTILSANRDAAAALETALQQVRGTTAFVQLTRRFQAAGHYPELLRLAQQFRREQVGVAAMTCLLDLKQDELLTNALHSEDVAVAAATAEAMGNTARGGIDEMLLPIVLDSGLNIEVRRSAVRAASRVNNGGLQLVRLTDEKSLDADLTQAVAAALHSAPSRQLREHALRLFPLPPAKDNAPIPPVGELLGLQGDPANGRLVFFTTGNCHKCHVVGRMGREIGPNLSEIASKLSPEALFESILYPSAGITHNYDTWTVILTSGTTVNGIMVSRTDQSVSLRGDDAIVREFSGSDIEEVVRQKISLMPADLQKTMSTQELADVVAYMVTLKKN